MTEKIKLSGGPDKTVTCVCPDNNGQLKIEYYDVSEAAQRLFGNDVAYTITVHEMDKLYATVNQSETSLISGMEQYFNSYSGIKKCLEENGIKFSVETESWA